MNEFTQDELHGILCSVIQSHCMPDSMRSSLKDKISNMIDNYCEHESSEYYHQLADCSYRFNRCKKCRREINRQAWNMELQTWENENP